MTVTLLSQVAPSSTNPEAMIAAAVAAAQAQQAAFNASMVSLVVLGLLVVLLIAFFILIFKMDALIRTCGIINRKLGHHVEDKEPDEPKDEKK